jgi:hypothetical protein
VTPKRINPSRERGRKFSPSSENQRPSPETQKPVFSLYYIQKSHCLSDCNKDEKAAFSDTLHKLSQLTWNEIILSPRHGLGCEKISRNSIKSAIPSHIKDDAVLIAFRFFGRASMVGYREGNTLHVIWLDRTFTLYNHG